MALIDKLKAALLQARKDRNAVKAASLSTLVGECETLAKAGRGELTDAVVVTVIKKFIKNIDDNLVNLGRTGALIADDMLEEKQLYEQFLPKQLSVAELEALIKGMIAEGTADPSARPRDIGDVMKRLKVEHAGTYDGAMASAILKREFGK